jgi:hypothetical protein
MDINIGGDPVVINKLSSYIEFKKCIQDIFHKYFYYCNTKSATIFL